jgi:hypothetical protein
MNLIKKNIKKHKIVLISLGLLILLSGSLFFDDVLAYINIGGDSLNKGLVGHWPLDGEHYNSNTGRVDDISGYQNHGTNNGSQIKNQGIKFNGSDNVDVGVVPLDTYQKISVSLWVKADTNLGGHDIAIGNADNNAGDGFSLSHYNDNGYFYFYHASDTWGIGAAKLGEWEHIVLEIDKGNFKKVYRNGVHTGTHSSINTNSLDYGNLRIGSNNAGGDGFNGNVADVKIFGRILTDSEVLDLYNGKDIGGTVLDLPLSEKTGAKDISGNEYNGTNNNAEIIGNGTYFNGTSNYIEIPDNGSLDIDESFTWSMWVNLDEKKYNDDTVFGKNSAYEFTIRDSSLKIVSWGDDWYPSVTVPTDEWVYLAVTGEASGASRKVYMNGLEVASGGPSYVMNVSTSDLQIGSWVDRDGNSIHGKINDLRIYNRTLSESEIESLYARGRGSISSGSSAVNLNKGLVLDMPLRTKDEKSEGTVNNIPTQDHFTCSNLKSCTYDSDTKEWSLTLAASSTDNYSGLILSPNPTKVISPANSYIAYSFEVYADEVVPIRIDLNNYGMDYSTGSNDNRQSSNLDINNTISGQWVKSSAIYQVDADQDYYCRNNIYFANDYIPDHDVTIKVRKIQHEIKDHATAFVDGTRLDKISDLTPYSNHGIIYGSTIGESYTSFDGIDDYISVPDDPSWSFEGNEPFSVSAFIRTSDPNQYRGGVLGNNEYLGGGYKFSFSGGNIYFAIHSNTNGYNTYTGFPSNTWKHIVGTYDGDRMRLYKDGDMVDTIAGVDLIDNGSDFLIGKAQQGGWEEFIGDVANVKIYNRAISGYEVQTLFDKERGNFGI